jgi:hypothetical protein
MGLADSLNNGIPQATAAARGTNHINKAPSHAPKLIPASQKKKGNRENLKKVAVIGPGGTGKTFSVFSLVKHLATKGGLNPEQIRIELIDLDDGLSELTDQCIIPDEYIERIFVSVCKDFAEVADATREAYGRLAEHKKQYGAEGAWIIVDNMERAWNYVQEDYSLSVYGMTLVERMKRARKSQYEAKQLGGKGEAVFDKNLDWGVIKPMHSDWAKSFEACGFNFVWLSPWKMHEEKDKSGNVVDTYVKFGSGDNRQIPSHIVRKYIDARGQRRADFVKARGINGHPKNIVDTTWTGIFDALDRQEEFERREMKAALERDQYGKKPEVVAPVDEKEQKVNEIMNEAVATSLQSAQQATSGIPDW